MIVGTSVAALTGLMFVVIALISENPQQTTSQGLAAFGTPTVVHYAVVLIISGLITAPWESLLILSPAITIIGLFGFAYSLIVLRRARRQTTNAPVFDDWLGHTAFPFLGYSLLAIAGIVLHLHVKFLLFSIGAVALLFMITGVHNACDTVTWLTVSRAEQEAKTSGAPEA